MCAKMCVSSVIRRLGSIVIQLRWFPCANEAQRVSELFQLVEGLYYQKKFRQTSCIPARNFQNGLVCRVSSNFFYRQILGQGKRESIYLAQFLTQKHCLPLKMFVLNSSKHIEFEFLFSCENWIARGQKVTESGSNRNFWYPLENVPKGY